MLPATLMQSMRPGSLAIWILGVVLLAFVAWMLHRRRLYTEYPIFGNYLAFHVLHAAIGLWVYYRTTGVIYWLYSWGGEAMDGPITLALIYEIFSKTLAPYPGIRRLGLTLFTTVAVTTLVVGTVIVFVDPATTTQRFNTAVVSMDRSLQFSRIALLFLLFAFHRLFGLSWRHYIFGLALGLGVGSLLSFVTSTVWLHIGINWTSGFVVLSPLSYDIGLVVWAYYFAASESKVKVTEIPFSTQLTRWNVALQEILPR